MTFKELPLQPQLQAGLDELGYTEPTPIQAQALPLLLKNPHTHVHGQAQTGTGKTLAFGLPLLNMIDPSVKKVQGLIVAPTRELAVQIHQSLAGLARFRGISVVAVYGGVSIEKQFSELRAKPHIVVGTPGRLNDHIERRTLALDQTTIVVLDEADIMLDMGFKDDVDQLIRATPANRSLWLFSATVKAGINDLMKTHMPNPVKLSASSSQVASSNTTQYYALLSRKNRFEGLCRIIETTDDIYGFIFCQTKALTAEIADELIKRGYHAQALHGDMSQALRNQVIRRFKNREFSLLVATDVAARGLDVPEITHVFNYGIPEDQESYIHRIGRTGRAGLKGTAIALIDPFHEFRIKSLVRRYKMNIVPYEIPSKTALMEKRLEKVKSSIAAMANKPMNSSYDSVLYEAFSKMNHEELVKSLVGCTQKIFGTFTDDQESLFAPSREGRSDSQESERGGDRYGSRNRGGFYRGRRSSGGFGRRTGGFRR